MPKVYARRNFPLLAGAALGAIAAIRKRKLKESLGLARKRIAVRGSQPKTAMASVSSGVVGGAAVRHADAGFTFSGGSWRRSYRRFRRGYRRFGRGGYGRKFAFRNAVIRALVNPSTYVYNMSGNWTCPSLGYFWSPEDFLYCINPPSGTVNALNFYNMNAFQTFFLQSVLEFGLGGSGAVTQGNTNLKLSQCYSTYTFTNTTLNPIRAEVYKVRPRTNIPFNTEGQLSLLTQGFADTNQPGGSLGVFTQEATPFKSSTFCSQHKILSKKQIVINPGSTHTIIYRHKPMVIRRNQIFYASNGTVRNWILNEGACHPLLKFIPVIGAGGTGQSATGVNSIGIPNIYVQWTIKHTYRFLPFPAANSNPVTFVNGNTAPTSTIFPGTAITTATDDTRSVNS